MEPVDRLRERFLVQQFQRGNAEAFLKLVRSFERRLLYFLRRFERDPERALDAVSLIDPFLPLALSLMRDRSISVSRP